MIWARVLKEVRKADSMILSAACAEMDNMYVYDGEFVLLVNDTQYSLLTQTKHKNSLSDIVYNECKLQLKLVKSAKKLTSVEDDIKQLQHLIGKEKLKIV